jgi:polysaccharide export outer membrane protein
LARLTAALCAGALLAAPLSAAAQTVPTAPITQPTTAPTQTETQPTAPAAAGPATVAAQAPAAVPASIDAASPASPPVSSLPAAVTTTTDAAPPPAISTPSVSNDGYVLGINDKLRILVFGEESLSGEFLVDSTGRVAMPFIGEVQAAGLTRSQFEDALEKRMREEQILLDPRVSIDLINFRPFYILGEVVRPGEYPSSTNLNVFNAVATAGGFTTLANQTRVMIKRSGEQTEREYSLLSPVTVNPGDTIRVLKGAFYILGEVNRPGEYPFSEGLTIQNAVATAGGFTYRANQHTIFVKHRDEAAELKVRMTASTPVEPGDTIRITERFF